MIKKPKRFKKVVKRDLFKEEDKDLLMFFFMGLFLGSIGSITSTIAAYKSDLFGVFIGIITILFVPWTFSFIYWIDKEVYYEEVKE